MVIQEVSSPAALASLSGLHEYIHFYVGYSLYSCHEIDESGETKTKTMSLKILKKKLKC